MVIKGTVEVIERTLFVFSFAPKCPTCTDETGTFKGERSALSTRKNRPFKNLHGSKNVQFFVTSCLTAGYKSRQKWLQNRPEVCFFRRNSVYNRLLSEKFIAYCPVRMNCRARSSWVSRPVALNICTGGVHRGTVPLCSLLFPKDQSAVLAGAELLGRYDGDVPCAIVTGNVKRQGIPVQGVGHVVNYSVGLAGAVV